MVDLFMFRTLTETKKVTDGDADEEADAAEGDENEIINKAQTVGEGEGEDDEDEDEEADNKDWKVKLWGRNAHKWCLYYCVHKFFNTALTAIQKKIGLFGDMPVLFFEIEENSHECFNYSD